MPFARVAVDVKTRALAAPFTYTVPARLDASVVPGCCVVVEFGRRPAVGYVLAVDETLDPGLTGARLLPIQQVLSEALFLPEAGEVAQWVAQEYASSLADAVRLFLPPGFTAKMVRDETSGAWALQQARVEPVDDCWVHITEQGRAYEPRKNAHAERAVVEALLKGPMRQVELGLAVSGVSTVVKRLEKKGVVACERKERLRGSSITELSSARAPRLGLEHLTSGQLSALRAIEDARAQGQGGVVLIDGVTGSGKTEVYLEAIERTLAAGKGACVLVPEISLTAQTVGRFRNRFGDAVAVLHSRLTLGERRDQWELVRAGRARVVVGARSALFAPLANPGIYIIDEEHESSYKQSSSPRYHAREVAARLAQVHGCPLVLGSATPSLSSLARCDAGSHGAALAGQGPVWTRVSMPERPGGRPMPEVQVVDMAQEFSQGWRSMFSRPLTSALMDVVERGEKAVLLLNQRGFARFLLCRDCGYVPRCEQCSTSLTYHERGHKLVCHTCGREYAVPPLCPECGSRYLRQFGAGTQRVEDELRGVLPEGFTVVRMDADTTKGKGGHDRCLAEFDEAQSAVLLGTQMIAKGLDFPQVTLAGVINADTTLKLADFRAAERTYDLLEQVAGRAGRGDVPGRVIIQTYQPRHPAILAVSRHDRSVFSENELAARQEVGYPPFVRLANVIMWGKVGADVEKVAWAVAEKLRDYAEVALPGCEILGPAECALSRVEGNFRWHVLVKAAPQSELGAILGDALKRLQMPAQVSLAIDVDPYDLL